MTLLSIYELLMNVQACKGWSVFMFTSKIIFKYVNFLNLWSPLCVPQLLSLHFTCSHKDIMLYLITPVNINVIIRLKRDAHSDSIPNIDLANAAFFFSKFVGLYLCFTSSPQACYSSIFGLYIMDAVWVSQGGVWLLGLQASQRDRVREGKRDIESGRLTESLSQTLASKRERLFASVQRRRNHGRR